MEGKEGSRRSSDRDQFQLLTELHKNHIAANQTRAKTDSDLTCQK